MIEWKKVPMLSLVLYQGRKYLFDGLCFESRNLWLRPYHPGLRVLGEDGVAAPRNQVTLAESHQLPKATDSVVAVANPPFGRFDGPQNSAPECPAE